MPLSPPYLCCPILIVPLRTPQSLLSREPFVHRTALRSSRRSNARFDLPADALYVSLYCTVYCVLCTVLCTVYCTQHCTLLTFCVLEHHPLFSSLRTSCPLARCASFPVHTTTRRRQLQLLVLSCLVAVVCIRKLHVVVLPRLALPRFASRYIPISASVPDLALLATPYLDARCRRAGRLRLQTPFDTIHSISFAIDHNPLRCVLVI